MRILQVYSGNLFGGIETLLLSLGTHTPDLSVEDREFALCFRGRLSEALTAIGSPVHILGRTRVRAPWTILRARRELANVLKTRRIDVVICHSVWSQSIFSPVARAAGLPSIFWLHDAARGKHWLERWAKFHRPDMVIANSRFTRSTADNIYPGVPSEVLYHPIGAPAVVDANPAETRAEFDTPADSVVIIQPSRLEEWKGHIVHLEALRELRDVPGWVVWFVGGAQRPHEEAYLAKLKQMAADFGIADRVRFLGQRKDVPRLLQAADIHCQPNSGPEPFGITFVEALYAGLPIVTTAMGGPMEVVDVTCGVLVPPGDTSGVATALRELVTNPERRRALGRGGPARAAALCDPKRQLQRLDDICARAAALKGRQA